MNSATSVARHTKDKTAFGSPATKPTQRTADTTAQGFRTTLCLWTILMPRIHNDGDELKTSYMNMHLGARCAELDHRKMKQQPDFLSNYSESLRGIASCTCCLHVTHQNRNSNLARARPSFLFLPTSHSIPLRLFPYSVRLRVTYCPTAHWPQYLASSLTMSERLSRKLG